MRAVRALDVSTLPTFAFGHRSILWWATVGLMAIEGTMFALVIAAYLFLRWRTPNWPPGFEPPMLVWGTLTTITLLISAIPNALAKRAAERLDLGKVRLWMVVCLVFGIAFIALRAMEFTALNVWYDSNAYGSIVWFLLGLHTTHVVTDVIDTAVLAALAFTGPFEQRRFVDISESALYWYFVVISWLPIYAIVYYAPRAL